MSLSAPDIQAAALAVLATPEPRGKAAAARTVAADWRSGALSLPGEWRTSAAMPPPARPAAPTLVPPGEVPRRRLNSPHGRIALLHAIAHIEFNAIDLAFDLIARFGGDARIPESQRRAFIDDWIGVGDDEARHFVMVEDRLNEMDARYGDLPAHSGLWDAAESTAHDLAARLAVAPLVLEARGLDVTPGMIERLRSANDHDSAAVLTVIYNEEIGHVGAGARWFGTICSTMEADPQSTYQALVRKHFKGGLKMPFNFKARQDAGLPEDFYLPLAQTGPGFA
ncbi:ferritin-like domain-containing protein [Maricaulis sp.]|uniref:ferritin-like domain-containing protein n=1 Tax=Maricaulis sp. TaxID=1486257 RepID=UPI00260A0D9A|nr:ferritin-like domain-containing protein [Maricaulis sp.]